jgi:hypothetical protein
MQSNILTQEEYTELHRELKRLQRVRRKLMKSGERKAIKVGERSS